MAMMESSPLPTTAVPSTRFQALTADALYQLRKMGLSSNRTLTDVLAAHWNLDARAVLRELAASFQWPVMETAAMLEMPAALDVLPLNKAMKRGAVLLRNGAQLLAVIPDPLDADLMTWMERCAGAAPVEFRLALAQDIHALLTRLEESNRSTEEFKSADGAARRDGRQTAVLSLSILNELASPAIKLVNSILSDALKFVASDIHVESTPAGMSVKFRIDGVLDHILDMHGVETAEHVVSRLKVLAELDISERRIPQDGSFVVESAGRDIDLRLSIMPSIHGEDAVIRVLDKRAMVEAYGALTLNALGFDAPSLSTLRRLAAEPYGMLLVTGPTGSGKTTTLYGALTEIHDGRSKIITIEDPVEFVHPHKNCVITQREIGLDTDSWEAALKNTLRQAPDVILMGEIRDRETMSAGLAYAQSGHLCLATLHANSANQALDRIINFFPEERRSQLLMDLSLNLRALVSQRLVPRQDRKGRHAAVEVMLNSPLISDLIFKGDVTEIKEIMKKSGNMGMQTFDQALFQAYEANLITFEDALRNADSLNDLRLQIKLNSRRARSQDLTAGTEHFTIV